MKIILQTNLNSNLGADGYCLKSLLSCIKNKDEYFIVTTGKSNDNIVFEGVRGISIKNKFIERKSAIIKKFLSVVLWPDSTIYNASKMVSSIKAVFDKENLNEIVAFSGDFTAQYVAMQIKKMFPRIIYKIVLWDPLPDANYIYEKRLNLKANINKVSRKALQCCDYAFMTQGIADYYSKKYSEFRDKFFVCGLPLLSWDIRGGEFSHSFDGVYRFLYTGSLNPRVRSVKGIIRFFEFLSDNNIPYELIIAGGVSKDAQKLFKKINIRFLGRVSKNEIALLYSKSDLLISVGNMNTLQTPSKIIDYISTGKKIISFESISNSQSSILLKDYANSLVVYDDEELDTNTIKWFLSKTQILNDKDDVYSKFSIHSKECNYAIIFEN